MRRTTPTPKAARYVKPGASLTNIAGLVKSVEIKDKDVLITMDNGSESYFGLNEKVIVNKPL